MRWVGTMGCGWPVVVAAGGRSEGEGDVADEEDDTCSEAKAEGMGMMVVGRTDEEEAEEEGVGEEGEGCEPVHASPFGGETKDIGNIPCRMDENRELPVWEGERHVKPGSIMDVMEDEGE